MHFILHIRSMTCGHLTRSTHMSLTSIDQTTLKEAVINVTPELPYMANHCNLHLYPESTFPWHWHNEVELFYMKNGELDYHLPSGKYTFKEGEGGFINANILHMTQCTNHLPCIQEEHIFLPEFIGGHGESILYDRYIHPITQNPALEFYRFDLTSEKDRKIIQLLKESYALYHGRRPMYEFDVRAKMTEAWKLLFEILSTFELPAKPKPGNERIKLMMSFIADCYQEKLTLEQIANAGFISIRECCRCFHDNLGETPFSYLTNYRLRRACDLLIHTDLSVTTISSTCGFGNSSYFGKIFREKFHCTPKVFRNQNRPQI